MAKAEKKVKFLQSLSLALTCLDDEVKHVQIVIVQNEDDKQLQMYFDVVDPSKIKLKDEVS